MAYEYPSIYFDSPIVDGRCLDIFPPEKSARNLSLFFIHGGGWTGGSKTNYHKIMRAFNQEGYICAATDYRLLNQGVTISDQIEDVRYGYGVFLKRLGEMNQPLNVVTIGSSAGAHRACLLSWTVPGQCGEQATLPPNINWMPPVAMAAVCPPVRFEPWEDIFPPAWDAICNIVGISYEEDPKAYERVSPVTYISPQCCPSFFLGAENEHEFPVEHVQQAVSMLKKHGVEAKCKIYTKAEHGFFYDLTRRQQKEAFRDILAFIANIAENQKINLASGEPGNLFGDGLNSFSHKPS